MTQSLLRQLAIRAICCRPQESRLILDLSVQMDVRATVRGRRSETNSALNAEVHSYISRSSLNEADLQLGSWLDRIQDREKQRHVSRSCVPPSAINAWAAKTPRPVCNLSCIAGALPGRAEM